MSITQASHLSDRLPAKSWSTQQLGEYLQFHGRKNAESLWRQGSALLIAREKIGHGQWGIWCDQYADHMSETEILHAQKLASKLKFEEIQGLGVTAAKIKASILKPKAEPTPTTEATEQTGEESSQEQTGGQEQTGEESDEVFLNGEKLALEEAIDQLAANYVGTALRTAVETISDLTDLPGLSEAEAVAVLVKAMKAKAP
jgi:hypothetical protein